MLKIVGVGKSHFADYVKSISSPDIEMEQITPHVYSFPGIRGCDPSMVLTSQGAVFIDTAQWITQLEQMIDFAKEKCGGVKYVINTESHIDHVFGNPYLKKEGATIISHEKMVDGYYKIPPAFNQTTYEYNLDLLKRQDPTQVAKLLPEGEEEIGKPDITFSDRMTLKLGDHTFQICGRQQLHRLPDLAPQRGLRRPVPQPGLAAESGCGLHHPRPRPRQGQGVHCGEQAVPVRLAGCRGRGHRKGLE